ncbi:bifunctional DNA-formamidopyrimidine glycosylase/DNA-(apurinic or apyrimidinic site) lyase [Moritella dasanensis]|uniref:bifunctional DNA-formamidopyrimidine glycosylase/DNA-(apurinic or apyrimidinic site) lyase n=1 Tax=Moritella dasanensis TaxID=428031 RepID=UPI0002FE55FD|nr:bifunctional DNA-formamidopyrimidine glycosylase/DNA-(apurinic or apyrimidinic site) lyase [Moritella dasanensis]
MPELPEVEVSRQGIAPYLENAQIAKVVVRNAQLRWPVPIEIQDAVGCTVISVRRRAKYLLLETDKGTIIIHLGMSGSLRVLDSNVAVEKHDHVDIVMDSGKCLRLNDPRRFGSVLWQVGEVLEHKLLASLGPEPLTDDFTAQRLFERSRSRKMPVKSFLMDNHNVVGVGNIYANEALFAAGISPKRAAGNVSLQRYKVLVDEVKSVLAKAIAQGGTTLKDFTQTDGKPGYFVQELQVYGKAGKPCPKCAEEIKAVKIGQRNTFYCNQCQR